APSSPSPPSAGTPPSTESMVEAWREISVPERNRQAASGSSAILPASSADPGPPMSSRQPPTRFHACTIGRFCLALLANGFPHWSISHRSGLLLLGLLVYIRSVLQSSASGPLGDGRRAVVPHVIRKPTVPWISEQAANRAGPRIV